MTSFNHYALGSVADWLHRVVGDLARRPGYTRVKFAPRPPTGELTGELTWAESSLKTAYGVIRCRWERTGDALDLALSVPEGVQGEIDMPGSPRILVDAGSIRSAFRIDGPATERLSRCMTHHR
ncbi:hypothetical protein [Nesterenkonia pannonica]|uniref:alpha-L-rhamnosidase C-terminal domain-containing protein n=1 Tax=Nesterenkonia pannonica TaxID=1548602 RepID=UPI0021646117|nr:alpha-L-rhamnosidase C-terminal domain-containing protein [Nesterenkonia pannonica]